MAEAKKTSARSRLSNASKAAPKTAPSTAALEAKVSALQKEIADLKAVLAAHCKKSAEEHSKLSAACQNQSSGCDEDARAAVKLLRDKLEGRLRNVSDLSAHRSWKI